MSTLYHISKDTVPSFYGNSDHDGGSAPVAGPSSQLRHASRSQCGKFLLLEAIDDDGHFDMRPGEVRTLGRRYHGMERHVEVSFWNLCGALERIFHWHDGRLQHT